MRCEQCGSENRDGSKFCMVCGVEIVVPVDALPHKMKTTKKPYIIAATLVIAAVVLSVGIWTSLDRQKGSRYRSALENGQRYLQELDYDRAEASLWEAIAIEPNKTDAYIDLGLLYEESGEYDKSELVYQEMIAAMPTEEDGYLYLANLYTQQGREEEREEVLQAGEKATENETLREEVEKRAMDQVRVREGSKVKEQTEKKSSENVFEKYFEEELVPQYGMLDTTQYSYATEVIFPSLHGIVSMQIMNLDSDKDEEMLVVIKDEDEKEGIRLLVFEVENEKVVETGKLTQSEIFTVVNNYNWDSHLAFGEEIGVYIKEDTDKTYILAERIYALDGFFSTIVALEYEDEELKIAGDLHFRPFMGGTSQPISMFYSKHLPKQWEKYNHDDIAEGFFKDYAKSEDAICVYGMPIDAMYSDVIEEPHTQYFEDDEEVIEAFFECFGIERTTLIRDDETESNRYSIPDYYADDSVIKLTDMYRTIFSNYGALVKWTDYSMVEQEEVEQKTDILSELPRNERTRLHTFFSNFGEVSFDRFSKASYQDTDLIDFALYHEIHNYFDTDAIIDGKMKVSVSRVEEIVERFFGVEVVDHSLYSNNQRDFNYFKDGQYYAGFGDGNPTQWSQVTKFLDNGDGTYTAYYDVYLSHVSPLNLYEDITDWKLGAGVRVITKQEGLDPMKQDAWEECIYTYSCVAVVKPYEPTSTGEKRYQLLSLQEEGTN